jgi:hypothetical protein
MLNLGLLVSHLGFYKQLVFYILVILLIAYVLIGWKLKPSHVLHYRFFGLFLRKSNKVVLAEEDDKKLEFSSDNSENSKREKLIQVGQMSEKYKTGVSLLTKETAEIPKVLHKNSDSSYVKTREDVFFHLVLAFNSLFFAKILTGWVELDKFGYISETNGNLWINLGCLILFFILVLVQLFQMKKYQTKFK